MFFTLKNWIKEFYNEHNIPLKKEKTISYKSSKIESIDQFYSLSQVSKMLEISYSVLHHAIKTAALSFIKTEDISDRYWLKYEDVVEFKKKYMRAKQNLYSSRKNTADGHMNIQEIASNLNLTYAAAYKICKKEGLLQKKIGRKWVIEQQQFAIIKSYF